MSAISAFLNRYAFLALVAGVIALAPHPVNAQKDERTAGWRICAERDLAVVMDIEEFGRTHTVPSAMLAKAMMTVLEARRACHEGKIARAIDLYDSIDFE